MIIAIKEKDRVVLGYSNADFWQYLTDADYVDEENVAIRFSSTGKTFALAKMQRISDLILYDEEFLEQEITPRTIVREVIPYIKYVIEQNNLLPENERGDWRNALVICDDEHIYDIGPKYAFREVDDYVCHGFKTEAVESVLDATADLPARERILKAIAFASKMYKEDFFPIVVTDTKSKRMEVIYEGGK